MTEIAGSNILITGGAGGIARQVALQLVRLGGNVVIWDLDSEKLARVVDELKATGGREARGYVCDVSDRRRVYATADRVKEEIGRVDVVVNSAGVVCGKRFLDCSDEAIGRTMDVNAMALFWTAKAFLPDMIRAGHGHLVTVASAGGLIGVVGLAEYCASKWAALGFDESLRAELKRSAPGVKTTVVCPYFVDTGMFRGVKTRFGWLLPILEKEQVARRIVRAIRRNRPRVAMPWLVHLVPLLRILPLSVFDAVAGLLGVHHAMDEFVGRSGKAGRDEK